jgi:cytoskeleton protein RodZ
METAGARLKKLRLEKGISLEEVQKKTKIHPDILKSIEDDSLVNLNPVYIKGFVKIYCGFLGVEPGEFLSGYKENGSVIPHQPPKEKNRDLFWKSGGEKPLLNSRVVLIIISVLVLSVLSLGLVSLIKFVSSKASGPRKPRTHLVLPKPKPAKKVKPPKASKAVPRGSIAVDDKARVSAPAVPLENPEPGVRIGLHALDDCWVQARIDGKIIFQNILKKGRFESWSAKDKVELSLGSAGGVRLEVNGKIIPSLGRKGQVLKNILITKDGLKVGK